MLALYYLLDPRPVEIDFTGDGAQAQARLSQRENPLSEVIFIGITKITLG